VLEKHHVLRAFEVMVGQDIGLLKGLSSESYWDFRNAVAGCILATDFAKHAFYCEQVGPPSSSFLLSAEGKAAFIDHIYSTTAASSGSGQSEACGTLLPRFWLGFSSITPCLPASQVRELVQEGASRPIPIQLEMELIIKCADISNVLKPFPVARRWALRVTDEFFEQGDVEHARGMDVTPSCDRSTASRVGLQVFT
jgi:hypothetical protein